MITNYFIEHNRYLNLLGIFVILGIAWLFSKKRSAINSRLVLHALVLEFVIAFCMLRTSLGQTMICSVASAIQKVYEFADKGSGFVFGNLTNAQMPWGFIFALKVLPIIIFFGALMSLLFYLGIVQKIVSAISYVVRPLLGTSGAETLCAIANSFLGQTEAPLLIRNYLHSMTKSELFLVMVSGMGTISGAILAVFAAMGVPSTHLLASSVMAIPGTILIAKILYPETEESVTMKGASATTSLTSSSLLDSIAQGTSDGMQLALNVGAMLISFLSLLAMLNYLLEYSTTSLNSLMAYIGLAFQLPLINLNLIFSYLFAPFGFLLGFTGNYILQAGQLLGTKVAVNELIAYGQMVQMELPPRMIALLTYALCGFSNFSCIGIQIGGIGALAPEKRPWLCELGVFAVLGGSLANLLSAMIAGLLL